jgi:hypothetical protein
MKTTRVPLITACLVSLLLTVPPTRAAGQPVSEGAASAVDGVVGRAEAKEPEMSGRASGDSSYKDHTAVTFGLSFTVNGRAAAGHLHFVDKDVEIGSVKLSKGIAVYTLPTDLAVGKHRLSLVFEPSEASAGKAKAMSQTYTITVKKTTAKRAKTLDSALCQAVQRLVKAKVTGIKGGTSADKSEYRAYNTVIAADRDAKGKRYWTFLRDIGPGADLGKVTSTASVYLKYRDFKPSTASKYESKAQTRCVG